MKIRSLNITDILKLKEYLDPYKAECMFICNNLQIAGIEYKGLDFEGEYFGYFGHHQDHEERLFGIIVHYWNGNIMMHASNTNILKQLTAYLQIHSNRRVEGILGPNIQANHTIKYLGLHNQKFRINNSEGLYQINLSTLNELHMKDIFKVVTPKDIAKEILINWITAYSVEALKAPNDIYLEKRVTEDINMRLQTGNSWVLLYDGIPVSFSAFNSRTDDIIQIGPVFTPIEHRNKGFARLLVAYTLHQEKINGMKQAILFTDNPAAIKAYLSIGFQKIGDYRLALLQKPVVFKKNIFRSG